MSQTSYSQSRCTLSSCLWAIDIELLTRLGYWEQFCWEIEILLPKCFQEKSCYAEDIIVTLCSIMQLRIICSKKQKQSKALDSHEIAIHERWLPGQSLMPNTVNKLSNFTMQAVAPQCHIFISTLFLLCYIILQLYYVR